MAAPNRLPGHSFCTFDHSTPTLRSRSHVENELGVQILIHDLVAHVIGFKGFRS